MRFGEFSFPFVKKEERERSGIKWLPEDVETQMMRENVERKLRFHPDEWLTWQQILSFFYRVTSQKQLQGDNRRHPFAQEVEENAAYSMSLG